MHLMAGKGAHFAAGAVVVQEQSAWVQGLVEEIVARWVNKFDVRSVDKLALWLGLVLWLALKLEC